MRSDWLRFIYSTTRRSRMRANHSRPTCLAQHNTYTSVAGACSLNRGGGDGVVSLRVIFFLGVSIVYVYLFMGWPYKSVSIADDIFSKSISALRDKKKKPRTPLARWTGRAQHSRRDVCTSRNVETSGTTTEAYTATPETGAPGFERARVQRREVVGAVAPYRWPLYSGRGQFGNATHLNPTERLNFIIDFFFRSSKLKFFFFSYKFMFENSCTESLINRSIYT